MNKLEQKIDSLSEKELINLIEETNDKYDNWNINLDKIVENLPNNNKISLSQRVTP